MEGLAVKDNYARFKGASWFEKLYGKDVLVVGQGGIGSWLSLLLARTGVNLFLFDGDLIEPHNQSGQLFKKSNIRDLKVDAIQGIIHEFCDENINIELFPEMYSQYSASNPIVMTGLDNMKSRRIVFENWIKYLKDNPGCKNEAILIDGRLNVEHLQIFCIKGNDTEAQEKYKNNFLFNDSEVEEQDCSFKQTSHCAAMIAGHMVGFLTNFFGEEFREVPFFYEYSVAPNFTNHEC